MHYVPNVYRYLIHVIRRIYILIVDLPPLCKKEARHPGVGAVRTWVGEGLGSRGVPTQQCMVYFNNRINNGYRDISSSRTYWYHLSPMTCPWAYGL